MWEPRHHTTLWVCTAGYKDSFTFTCIFQHLMSQLHLDSLLFSYMCNPTLRSAIYCIPIILDFEALTAVTVKGTTVLRL
jgi:hypothetical protein